MTFPQPTLINFAYPLTDRQREQIEACLGAPLNMVVDVPVFFKTDEPFAIQMGCLLGELPLSSQDWQSRALLVNLPSQPVIAALLLAEIHGRAGHFPTVLRLRLVEDNLSPIYELAEIVNLEAVRSSARKKRG